MTQNENPEGPTTEEHLVRALDGDRDGMSLLCEETAPALLAWANLRIHPSYRGRLDPEDVVQEVWWRAMDGFGSFDPAKGAFRGWLFRIATNVLTDSYRRLAVRGHLGNEQHSKRMQELPPDISAQMTSITGRLTRDENGRKMVEEIKALEEGDRALVVHCGLERLTAAEVATLLNLSEDAVAKRWQRLRSRLREAPAWQALLS